MFDAIADMIIFSWKWLTPLKDEGLAFTDMVSGEKVHHYRDAFGKRWLKTSKYSFFKIEAKEEKDGKD